MSGPDADIADAAGPATEDAPAAAAPTDRPCPAEMVHVPRLRPRGYCVDRWEASLVDGDEARVLSPHYPPTRGLDRYIEARRKESGGLCADLDPKVLCRQMAFPAVPAWQRQGTFEARASSRRGVLPNGYLTRNTAAAACRAAGKRLCTLDEWRTACRGEAGTKFPYGSKYEPGRCNVFREDHPSNLLFGRPALGLLDPRLNLVASSKGPLLRKTGATASCDSRWGDDAAKDMVGNLDEWLDDTTAEHGAAFVGGFYSRAQTLGCDARISSHLPAYFDYSTGTRCCADPAR